MITALTLSGLLMAPPSIDPQPAEFYENPRSLKATAGYSQLRYNEKNLMDTTDTSLSLSRRVSYNSHSKSWEPMRGDHVFTFNFGVGLESSIPNNLPNVYWHVPVRGGADYQFATRAGNVSVLWGIGVQGELYGNIDKTIQGQESSFGAAFYGRQKIDVLGKVPEFSLALAAGTGNVSDSQIGNPLLLRADLKVGVRNFTTIPVPLTAGGIFRHDYAEMVVGQLSDGQEIKSTHESNEVGGYVGYRIRNFSATARVTQRFVDRGFFKWRTPRVGIELEARF